jgi:hypothetical protein
MHSTQEEPLYMNRLTKRQRGVRAESCVLGSVPAVAVAVAVAQGVGEQQHEQCNRSIACTLQSFSHGSHCSSVEQFLNRLIGVEQLQCQISLSRTAAVSGTRTQGDSHIHINQNVGDVRRSVSPVSQAEQHSCSVPVLGLPEHAAAAQSAPKSLLCIHSCYHTALAAASLRTH